MFASIFIDHFEHCIFKHCSATMASQNQSACLFCFICA